MAIRRVALSGNAIASLIASLPVGFSSWFGGVDQTSCLVFNAQAISSFQSALNPRYIINSLATHQHILEDKPL